MKIFTLIIFILLSIIMIECNNLCEESDTQPPVVQIILPENGATVSEIVTITCLCSDNEDIDSVEFMIDGYKIHDATIYESPYSYKLNTFPFLDDSRKALTARAYDTSNNYSDSEPVYITIDNTNSAPDSVAITNIEYDQEEMKIIWSKSKAHDFDRYELLFSDSSKINTVFACIDNIDDTVFTITDFDPTQENWFWIRVQDSLGYSSISNGKMIKDLPPVKPIFYSYVYDDASIYLSWQMNSEDDFASYTLFESVDDFIFDSRIIYTSTDREDTSKIILDINEDDVRYYKLKVTDYWELSSSSEVFEFSFSKKDEFIYLGSNIYEIFRYNINTNSLEQLTFDGSNRNPIYMNDIDKIAFSSNNCYNLSIMDKNGESQQVLYDLPTMCLAFDYFSVNTTLYCYVKDGNRKIASINIETDEFVYITNPSAYNDNDPSINNYGNKLIYTSDRTGINQIYLLNLDSSEEIQITFTTTKMNRPKWSKLKNGFYYIELISNQYYIKYYNFDDNTSKVLFKTDYNLNFFMSPDEKQIAITLFKEDNTANLYIYNTENENLEQKTFIDFQFYQVKWYKF